MLHLVSDRDEDPDVMGIDFEVWILQAFFSHLLNQVVLSCDVVYWDFQQVSQKGLKVSAFIAKESALLDQSSLESCNKQICYNQKIHHQDFLFNFTSREMF